MQRMVNGTNLSTTTAVIVTGGENGEHFSRNGILDETTYLRKELEQERALRKQLEQQLNHKLHGQQLLESSYEDLVQKYKSVVGQAQQMSLIIERYKNVVKQLEQEKRMILAENQSFKAQETVAHDKHMLYNILIERSKKLEEENSSLVLENETHQRQYEKCIEDISKQVVQALLTQKTLQEQCVQLQDRIRDLERDNSEYSKAENNNTRQAFSDSRLVWNVPRHRQRINAASPSADSVKSMPAQHLHWAQRDSSHSLDVPHCTDTQAEELSSSHPWISRVGNSSHQQVCVETEFPANDGSPKVKRRSVDRHPSIGSLDSAYHSRAFIKHNGTNVRYTRSVSAEALRDMRVYPKQPLSVSQTAPHSIAQHSDSHVVHALVHQSVTPDQQLSPDIMTDSGVINDPFADETDDILSKHQSLIVGSYDDIFSEVNAEIAEHIRKNRIQEDEGEEAPAPPPRPSSRSSQSASSACEVGGAEPPPPLPPKQYRGSLRRFKPLPKEPDEPPLESIDDKNTDTESIKQEINDITSRISRMAASANQ